MNILVDNLYDYVFINDKKYKVNSDFKTMIKIVEIAEDENLSTARKLAKTIAVFYKTVPESFKEAVEGIKTFYGISGKEKGTEYKKLYSFSRDADLIYSAFYSQYNIDLTKDNMHFKKFLALFSGLCGENCFTKAVSVRSLDLSKIKNKNLFDYYKKLKRKFQLEELSLEEGLKAVF